jgi:hypothetical protein
LLDLREREANLAILREFEEARALKREADRIEKFEQDVAKHRAVETMRIEFANLQRRQKRELDSCSEFADHRVRLMEKSRDAELLSIHLICERLTAILNEPHIRKLTTSSLQGGRRRSRRPIRNARSARSMKGKALPLTGLDIRQYIRVKKAEKG